MKIREGGESAIVGIEVRREPRAEYPAPLKPRENLMGETLWAGEMGRFVVEAIYRGRRERWAHWQGMDRAHGRWPKQIQSRAVVVSRFSSQ